MCGLKNFRLLVGSNFGQRVIYCERAGNFFPKIKRLADNSQGGLVLPTKRRGFDGAQPN